MTDLRLTGGNLRLPSGAVADENISASTMLDADKLEHIHKAGTNFDLPIGGTPAAREEIVFVAEKNGVLRGFHALLNDTGTSTDVDFDLKVNGVSVLSAAVNITESAGDGSVADGTISNAAISEDDIISISLAVTSATGAQGPYAWVVIDESAP